LSLQRELRSTTGIWRVGLKEPFQRCVLPASSERWWFCARLKRRCTFTKVHCTIFQKAVIFILVVVRIWHFIHLNRFPFCSAPRAKWGKVTFLERN
jgi:hypothetical protein